MRVAATFGGVLALGLLAAALTEATVALGHTGKLANDTLLRPAATPAATPMPVTVPATVTPAPTPLPTATPVVTPIVPVATTNSFVRLRAGKSTSTAVLSGVDGGTVVQILPDSDAQWQQVRLNGLTGYIFKSYLAY